MANDKNSINWIEFEKKNQQFNIKIESIALSKNWN